MNSIEVEWEVALDFFNIQICISDLRKTTVPQVEARPNGDQTGAQPSKLSMHKLLEVFISKKKKRGCLTVKNKYCLI